MLVTVVSLNRVVAPGDHKEISEMKFQHFGSHSNEYPCAYLTAAAAIGVTKENVDTFIKRLGKVLESFKTKDDKTRSKKIETPLNSDNLLPQAN